MIRQIINITDEYKYNGVVCTSDEKMKFVAEQLSERTKKAYYALKTNFLTNINFSMEIMLC